MVTEFRLPEVGENIETGQIVKLMVSVGDTVQPDESVLELETDKAVIEVPVSVGGVVKEILVSEGDELQVGQLILTVDTVSMETSQVMAETEPAEPVAEISLPDQESVAEKAEPGAATPDGGEAIATAEIPPLSSTTPPPEKPRIAAPAAPSVRRLARELGVDINQIAGSGPGGRISMEDVKSFVRQSNLEQDRARPAEMGIEVLPLPDFTKWGQVEREPMSSIRSATARRLSYAWTSIPHVTHFDQADITELDVLRKRFVQKAEGVGGKLTVTAIILKVVASALSAFPKVNASLDMANQEVIYKKYYHIGVAVDTQHGLLVPVIRDVDRKNIIELSVELTQISEKARNRKVTLDDLAGSTFTVTNLGGIGGTNFTPIINPPDVAILGISRANRQPVFKNGGFEPRLIMPLSLSYDHRLIDGADAARFVRWVAEALEQPFLLALEG